MDISGSTVPNLDSADLPATDPGLQSARDAFVAPKQERLNPWWYVLGLVFFVVTSLGTSPQSIAVIVSVLTFHELGHVAAMRLTGHRDLRILFIPFFGAIATGRRTRASSSVEQALVLLAGPLPGLILALILAIAVHPVRHTLLGDAVFMLVFINGFNLLPFVPLDGGRFLEVVALSRWVWVATAARIVSIVAMGALAYALQSIPLAIIALMTVPATVLAARIGAEARALRRLQPEFPAPGASLSAEQLATLFESAKKIVPRTPENTLATRRARVMWELNVALGQKPASAAATFALLVVFIASWVIGVAALRAQFRAQVRTHAQAQLGETPES